MRREAVIPNFTWSNVSEHRRSVQQIEDTTNVTGYEPRLSPNHQHPDLVAFEIEQGNGGDAGGGAKGLMVNETPLD